MIADPPRAAPPERKEDPALQTALVFIEESLPRWQHAEAVAECYHCNVNYIVKQLRKALDEQAAADTARRTAEQERDKWFVECERLGIGLLEASEDWVDAPTGEVLPEKAVDAAFQTIDDLTKQFDLLKENGTYNWKQRAEVAEARLVQLAAYVQHRVECNAETCQVCHKGAKQEDGLCSFDKHGTHYFEASLCTCGLEGLAGIPPLAEKG